MNRRQKLLSALAFLAAGAVAVAGIRDHHLHQFPQQDMAMKTVVIPIRTVTESLPKVVQFSILHDWLLVGVKASVRNMTGTITQATLVLYNNDNIVTYNNLTTAIDLYDGALASAGTIYSPEFSIDGLRPIKWKSGTTGRVDVNLAGTNTPTLNDITLQLLYRTPSGQEAQ